MSSVDDLVTWLREQLDDDERVARKAGSRALAWPVNGTWHLEGVEHDVVGEEEAFCHPHNVAHIARHDPARVLAEVDAKRRILDAVYPEVVKLEDTVWSEFSNYPEPDVPELLLKTLALPYADRPGYRDEWEP